jgi:predicted transcriptional regulator
LGRVERGLGCDLAIVLIRRAADAARVNYGEAKSNPANDFRLCMKRRLDEACNCKKAHLLLKLRVRRRVRAPAQADNEGCMAGTMDKDNLIELTAGIVSAYVSSNPIASADITKLIREVHAALHRTATGAAQPVTEPPKPAVPVKKSITPDYIVCLEDGQKFKSLKRHLRTHYDLTPEQYREKWGLPPDYPMVAPNYAKARSTLAKKMGLGQKR